MITGHRNFYISNSDYKAIQNYGKGNASEGLRTILEIANKCKVTININTEITLIG